MLKKDLLNIRLSAHIKPKRYRLIIKPDLKGFTFQGEENIFLVLGKPTNRITLHSKELEIFDVEFYHPSLTLPIKGRETRYDEKTETATFTFPKKLPKGKGELRLNFKGVLNDFMRGFYRSRYIHKGKEKHIATTQFEATDARRAFPCFDEPAHKAVFDVTLIIPKGLRAISNTIETEISEHQSGYQLVKFAPTPKMSTYLLAMIVGDFEFIEGWTRPHHKSSPPPNLPHQGGGKGNKGTLVRVFVTPGKKHQAKFALDTAIKCLEFYNQYFDIPYPLPVLDLIAIPDFSHGAMENWGAVTYRENALLVDPEHSSAASKQYVALVIAHELAHQWFGNLVTMEWWTHLWLNEGFASYIEYLAVDHLFPKWDIWTQFAFNDLGIALKLDALKNTHPIEVEVHHPDEIGEIFDEVSYSKGASIIRMLAGYLGEKDFRDGLRHYLKKHSYKNASTVHLWQAFEKISKKPVQKMMQNWTAKPGYPVVRLVEEKNQLILSQSRFFSSPISKKQTGDRTVWPIPLSYKTNKTKQALFDKKSATINKPKGNWIKFNSGETGFYRVDYPAQMLAALRVPITTKKLPPIDRLAVVRDAFALAEAGELPTTQALNLLGAYAKETDYTVWVELAAGLAALRNLLFGQVSYPFFEKFAREIFKKIADKTGWRPKAGERHTQGLLRSLGLQQLAVFRHQPTLAKGLRLFKKSKNISPDIRGVVYQIAAQEGGKKQHQNFIRRYKNESLSEEKNRLGRALGQFADIILLKKTLNFALSKDVRIQDTAQIFASVWNNPLGRDIVWQFTKRNWKILLKRYPASGHIIARFIKPAGSFVKAGNGDNVKRFFKSRPAPGAERATTQVLEKIYSNASWLKRDGKHIERWLKNYGGPK